MVTKHCLSRDGISHTGLSNLCNKDTVKGRIRAKAQLRAITRSRAQHVACQIQALAKFLHPQLHRPRRDLGSQLSDKVWRRCFRPRHTAQYGLSQPTRRRSRSAHPNALQRGFVNTLVMAETRPDFRVTATIDAMSGSPSSPS